MRALVHFPPGLHSVVISSAPVAKTWPSGQVKAALDPKAVAKTEASLPGRGTASLPTSRGGQSAENLAENLPVFFTASEVNLTVVTRYGH